MRNPVKYFWSYSIFIICKVSNLTGHYLKHEYLCCSALYGISWLSYPTALPIGKSIILLDIKFKYKPLPFFGCGIQNKLEVNVKASEMYILKKTHAKHIDIVTKVIIKYSRNIQAIIDYNNNVQKDNQHTFNAQLLDSTTFILLPSKICSHHYSLLTTIDDHNFIQTSNGERCYVFNVQTESHKISIIKKFNCDTLAIRATKLRCNQPVIFGRMQFDRSDTPLFYITYSSYVLFDFCTDLETILSRRHLFKMKGKNYSLHIPFVIPKFQSIKKAHSYAYLLNNSKKMVIFSVNVKQILNINNYGARFRSWCRKCKKINTSLRPTCCTNYKYHSDPWLACTATMVIKSSNKRYTGYKITVDMQGIKLMFKYLVNQSILISEIRNHIHFIYNSITSPTQTWNSESQCTIFIPIIRTFFDNLLFKTSADLEFDIKAAKNKQVQNKFLCFHIRQPNHMKRKLNKDIIKPNMKRLKTL